MIPCRTYCLIPRVAYLSVSMNGERLSRWGFSEEHAERRFMKAYDRYHARMANRRADDGQY
jgi:hypothetical protein